MKWKWLPLGIIWLPCSSSLKISSCSASGSGNQVSVDHILVFSVTWLGRSQNILKRKNQYIIENAKRMTQFTYRKFFVRVWRACKWKILVKCQNKITYNRFKYVEHKICYTIPFMTKYIIYWQIMFILEKKIKIIRNVYIISSKYIRVDYAYINIPVLTKIDEGTSGSVYHSSIRLSSFWYRRRHQVFLHWWFR